MRQLVSADSVWPRLAAALDEGLSIHRRENTTALRRAV
jgi:hypothetical protein